MSFDFSQAKTAVVIGAGHGIGLSIVQNLLKSHSRLQVVATYRKPEKARSLIKLATEYSDRLMVSCVDPANESEVAEFANELEPFVQVDVFLNAVGFLHDETRKPEKSLRDISTEQMLYSFQVNLLPTLLFAKHLKKYFANRTPSLFSSVSAKVGSISDNRLGGWYGYLTSKAALNMALKNISIEWKRYQCSVVSIHPGTTVTELSKPFIAKTPYKLHTPEESAANILSVLHSHSKTGQCRFLTWDGEELPW